ncbi:hypothetical protein SSX86_021054 [Deinandra increscens subsp. villosa]|uniref:Uncharacterized protein n=1 Tax=Deinandra increscens subsp. villosa TaxID=3103831 RepID=A0AAP0CTX5_9ASTR
MAGGRTFLLFICIAHFFTINGEQLTRREAIEIIIGGGDTPSASPPPQNQNRPPPPPSPPPKRPPPPPPPSGFESSRLALVFPVIQAFKQKIKSDPKGITKTWTGTNICRDYKGFLCDVVPGYNEKALAGVKFNNFNFSGPDLTLGGFLTSLPDLVFFHANSNNFHGPIPTDLNKLPYFYELDLSNNRFSGTFPYQVLRANNLQFLDLRFNGFAGTVPPEIFILNLDLLFINNNNFVEKLPDNLGKTTALYLTMANNGFVGGIPRSIGQASNTLLEVLFLNNKLTGCLPYEIGLLKKATVFDVGSNYLTGPIPHSFRCLTKMDILNLARNEFYGAVPEAVCGLPELSNFTVSYNYFTEVGPVCRKLIENGVLDVKMNCILDLPNQRSREDCGRFFSMTRSCPDEESMSYVPCSSKGYFGDQLESSGMQMTAPAIAPAPVSRSYGGLSPH